MRTSITTSTNLVDRHRLKTETDKDKDKDKDIMEAALSSDRIEELLVTLSRREPNLLAHAHPLGALAHPARSTVPYRTPLPLTRPWLPVENSTAAVLSRLM